VIISGDGMKKKVLIEHLVHFFFTADVNQRASRLVIFGLLALASLADEGIAAAGVTILSTIIIWSFSLSVVGGVLLVILCLYTSSLARRGRRSSSLSC
jgi:hypothetical protein